MAMPCKICNHADRLQIDEALVRGVSARKIAKDLCINWISWRQIQRHKFHILDQLVDSDLCTRETLVQRIRLLSDNVERSKERSLARKDEHAFIKACAEQRHLLRFEAEVMQMVEAQAQIHAIVIHPSWIEYREAIFMALRQYPSARAEVIQNLKGLELEKKMELSETRLLNGGRQDGPSGSN